MKRLHKQRRKNLNIPGHAHELTFSCYRRFKFLAREQTCRWLAEAIDTARVKHQFSLWAYVFMPEHVHLIVCPQQPEYDIASIRKSIKEPIARKAIRHMEEESPQGLEKITRQRGHRTERLFWQSGGGYDRNIEQPATLERMIDYLHANPIRRGLVLMASGWPWSSASWYEGSNGSVLSVDPIPDTWAVD